MRYKKLFIFFSLFFIAFAVYHAIGIFWPIDTSPWWRHLIFFALSIFGIYGILVRPKYFVYLFGVLLVQQFYSHGSDFIAMWCEQHKIDWISLLVLIVLPIVFVFLILDAKNKG